MAGKFTKVELLGSGTFGRAWLVKNNLTGKNYVCKEVTVSGMVEKAREQSLTEVAALAKCKHLNVIRYRQAFVDKGMLNIVMEYADAGDLHQAIEKQKGKLFEENVIIDWFVQLAFALRYIHKLNILHRDLKTQNIFLTGDNLIKIGDFGIARILQNTDDHAQTAIGTPFYLSPEICQQLPYNHKSDMWAAGCVLYELCCLTNPFEAPNLNALILKILRGTYTPIPSKYGPLLEDLIQVLLSVEVEGRPSAEQVLCIPLIQPYINKYVERAMSQTPAKPKVKTMQENVSSRIEANKVASQSPDQNATPSPPAVKPEMGMLLKRTYSVDSLKSNKSTPPVPETCPLSSLDDSPVIQTVKFVGGIQKQTSAEENIQNRAIKRSPVPIPEKENDLSDGPTSSKRFRRMSLRTPSPVEKVRSDKEVNSARCMTPPRPLIKKLQVPQMSLYKEILRRKALKEIQKQASSSPKSKLNGETYTIARSAPLKLRDIGDQDAPARGTPIRLTKKWANRVNTLLFENCCTNMENVYQTMENLREKLEADLGQEAFVSMHHALKEAVLAKIPFANATAKCDAKGMAYFPVVQHLIQLEILAKQSIF